MWADLTNALFELAGAALVWVNVRQILRDQAVRGIFWPAQALFAAWGWWNVYYYGPHLGQWLSWGAGIVMVLANTVWVILAIRYRGN